MERSRALVLLAERVQASRHGKQVTIGFTSAQCSYDMTRRPHTVRSYLVLRHGLTILCQSKREGRPLTEYDTLCMKTNCSIPVLELSNIYRNQN
jgi:hypothetical protein